MQVAKPERKRGSDRPEVGGVGRAWKGTREGWRPPFLHLGPGGSSRCNNRLSYTLVLYELSSTYTYNLYYF